MKTDQAKPTALLPCPLCKSTDVQRAGKNLVECNECNCEASEGEWQRHTRAQSPAQAEWLPIESAPPYKTLLTIHQDDLYPVCAFYFDQDGQRFWMRIIEGPEDVIRPEEGDHNPLLRPPTHWMYPPDAPLYQPPKDNKQ